MPFAKQAMAKSQTHDINTMSPLHTTVQHCTMGPSKLQAFAVMDPRKLSKLLYVVMKDYFVCDCTGRGR